MRIGQLLGLIGIVLLSACAQTGPQVKVMVVPSSADGHVGAVVIRPLDGCDPVTLDEAYVAAEMNDSQTVQTSTISADRVDDVFGATRMTLPKPPATVLVFFVEGTDTLQPEAKRAIDSVIEEIDKREAPEITVIGHTDFVGSDEYNDKLSLQRAEKVRDQLVRRGIDKTIIQLAGRGKREPIVATTSAEQQNRRVEITVR